MTDPQNTQDRAFGETPGDTSQTWTKWLVLYLRIVGASALLAFGAALMPSKWIIEIAEALGVEPFPDSPLVYYLARNLSALYGFVGVAMIAITLDFDRYRPSIRLLAIGTISFGALQLVVDAMAQMPWWWIFGESISTILGGVLMYWLDQRSRSEGVSEI